ncbi:MAG TPA: bifunctional nuclease family protein [Anaerohalosphaeraceae bacterium]|nr:bifunctional nuclease family protein [Anaerohalosphaeraceae bacterium]HOL89741.1 bifunctional nuclease family protein [Anaerohalosphaeraceae bacterium]HPP57350.1 bifunctional nuclease family protein [Anaerohalosphaeraceae bacterium]
MEVPVELSQILINETVDQQIIVLKEKGGQRSFPIVIGMPEILAIDRRLKGYEMPRPLTHDLLASVIEQMGGRVLKIVICDLREHTFYARIHIEQNGRVIEVDSRPSDAIALASGLQVPIFVEDSVFEKLQM